MFALISLAITMAAIIIGYTQAKSFVTQRLRYVDAVHTLRAPLLAGLGAALLAAPVVWLLPVVGPGTALCFGAAVGYGVASGARDIRRRLPAGTA